MPFKYHFTLSSLILLFIFIFSLSSFLTLKRFPPINFDEVGNVVLSEQFLNRGETDYPLMKDVVHPYFEDFVSSGQTGIRGIHMAFLAQLQNFIGKDLYGLRIASFVLWILTGGLLFFLLKSLFKTKYAYVGVFIWTISLDGVLSSHLIRPDILLGFIMVSCLSLLLVKKKPTTLWASYITGILWGSLLGIHPHALAWIVIFGFLVLLFKKEFDLRKQDYGRLTIGFLFGFIIWICMSNFPNYFLSNHSYVGQLYSLEANVWKARLVPWTFLSDMCQLLINPSSFYLDEKFQNKNLWIFGGLFRTMSYLFSIAWITYRRPKQRYIWIFLIGFLLLWVAIGFGHLRRELIYSVPLTLMGVPLIAWTLVDVTDTLKQSLKGSPLTLLILGGFLFVSLVTWFLKGSLIYYLLLLGLVFILHKAKDRFVISYLAIGLLIIFSLQIDGKFLLSFLHNDLRELNCSFFVIVGLIGGPSTAIGIILILKKHGIRKAQFNKTLGSLLLLGFLLWSIGWGGLSTCYHMVKNARENTSIDETWQRANAIVPDKDLKILGPAFLWANFGETYRDINALVLDYFYSGQKRPWECIKRYQPDIVIIDVEIRKRFLQGQPMGNIIKVPHTHIGSIPQNQHHSQLDFFQIKWKK